MAEVKVGRAIAVAAPIIVSIVTLLFALSFLISALLGLPSSLALSLPFKVAGAAVLLAGLAIMGWLFRYRGPLSVIVSTYVTFGKLFRRVPLARQSGRTEPLVVGGPQRYVRHPLYLGVVVMVLGWALLTAYSFLFVATLVLFLWFRLILIPFEEKELRALFGDQYGAYSEDTPTMIPFTKRKRRGRRGTETVLNPTRAV